MYDGSSKKTNLDNSSLTVVATTSNFNESSQADKTQEIYERQDILDLSIKKRKLDNSSLAVEDASSNFDNKNADSSTTLADYGLMKATEYRYVVDTNYTRPHCFGDCFWDIGIESLVEKDPDFVD
jgi:transcription elongation factor